MTRNRNPVRAHRSSSSRNTTPDGSTTTSASNTTGPGLVGRAQEPPPPTRTRTGSRSRPRTIRWTTPTSRATSRRANTAAVMYRSGTRALSSWRSGATKRSLSVSTVSASSRYALIRTGDKNWLAHLMTDEPRPPIVPDSLTDPRPMLATDEPIERLDERDWAFEGKWDGYRLLVRSIGGEFRLTSRSGIDMTKDFPEFASIADDLGLMDVVLDGEAVAIDSTGRTNFTLFTSRKHTEEPYTLKLHLFDILYLNGTSLLRKPWSVRRELLEELAPAFRRSAYVDVPPAAADTRERGGRVQPRTQPRRCCRQAPRLGLSARSTLHQVAETQELERHRGRRRRVPARAWQPVTHHRFAAARPARGDRAAIRGPRRHRIHRRAIALSRRGTRAAGDLPVTVPREARPPPHRVERGLGAAQDRRRGALHGLDHRRPPTTPELARHPPGQAPPGDL